jgi:hypothetical protein
MGVLLLSPVWFICRPSSTAKAARPQGKSSLAVCHGKRLSALGRSGTCPTDQEKTSSAARFRMVADVDAFRQVKDVFGYVGRVIGDPLQVPYNGK